MSGRLLLTLVLVTALAGCAVRPDVPPDAVTATDPDLPGLVLHAWIEQREDAVRLSGLFESTGGVHTHRADCGHPWNSTITGPSGEAVPFEDRPRCPEFYYEEIRDGQFLEYRHTWDQEFHDLENKTHEPAPPGGYTWTLGVDLVGSGHGGGGNLSVSLPFTLE